MAAPQREVLSRGLLPILADRGVAVPRYDAASIRPTVLHFGPGVFHRAHQAVYGDSVLGTGSLSGAVCAVSLRSRELRDALRSQDQLYSVLERDNSGDRVRVVGSIREVLVAPEEPEAVLRRMTDPLVSVVTISVTEKGYCAAGATGALDTSRSEIKHDISYPAAPESLLGFLVEGLARRRAAGVEPFAVASCDNLQANGAATRRLVTELAASRSDDLAEWIARHVAFPSSMVDRMVPETTEEVRSLVRSGTGYEDSWPVVTEPFSQWVLEDAFPAGRPPWERVGVELVRDVAPYEQAKLRILNGAHSAFAYFGLLCGYTEIADAAVDPALNAIVLRLLHDEVIPTLTPPPGLDLAAYADQVLSRFENRTLGYTTAKVAGDGSQKLPIRILATVRDRMRTGGDFQTLAAVLAAYVACLFGPRASALAIQDPALAQQLGAGPVTAGSALAAMELVLRRTAIVGDLADAPGFVATVQRHAEALWQGDPRVLFTSGLA